VRRDVQAPLLTAELSDRELAVATRVADGVPLKTIAAQLEISVQATSTYLTRAQRKLGQPSRWRMAALLRGPLPAFAGVVARWKIELSPAELDLGEMLLNGLSNADIARVTGTSNKLVGRLIARLLRKLELGSRGELFDLAARSNESGPLSATGIFPTEKRPTSDRH